MKKFRVEFSNSENACSAIFDTYDELTSIEAGGEDEAIEFAKDWYIESARNISGMGYDEAAAECGSLIWKATEI